MKLSQMQDIVGCRAVMTNVELAKKLYKDREKAYKSVADIVVNVEEKSLEQICKEIAKRAKAF